MKTTLTPNQINLLKEALDYNITRYLIVNSINGIDGIERAERHINISKKICEFIFDVKSEDKYNRIITDLWVVVHDYLAEILTDRMDEVIGFPVFEPLNDVDIYKYRFFNVIISNIHEIKEMVHKSLNHGNN